MLVLYFEPMSFVSAKWPALARKSTRKKRLLCQSNGTSNDFIIGNNANADATLNEILKFQTNRLVNNFERCEVGEGCASHDQVVENSRPIKSEKRSTMLLQLSKIESMTQF